MNLSDPDLRHLLCTARILAGLSQRDLGKRLGCSHVYVGHVERGHRRITELMVVRWADECGHELRVAKGGAVDLIPPPQWSRDAVARLERSGMKARGAA